MKWQKATMIFTGVIFALIVVWDVFVLFDGGTESSISHLLIISAYKYPLLPFSLGVVVGHLFWRMRETKETAEVTKGLRK